MYAKPLKEGHCYLCFAKFNNYKKAGKLDQINQIIKWFKNTMNQYCTKTS